MLKLHKEVGRSGALFAATFVVIATTALGAAGMTYAAPMRHQSLRAWLNARGVLIHRSHAGGHLAHTAIVGGNQISIDQAPWQVVMFGFIEEEGVLAGVLICGGSILDTTHVLTAGHCLYNPETGVRLPADDVVVVAGVTDLESEHEEDAQFRPAADLRVHPFYDYAAGAGAPDDVAVVTLSEELTLSSAPGSAANSIGLVGAGETPSEGTPVNLTGYGLENPNAASPDGTLNSIGMTLGFSRKCGGEADAVFLCTSATTGSACFGDSGSGLTSTTGTPALVGVADTVTEVSGEFCRASSTNGFVNVAAPEIRDFIEGVSSLPHAPRGGNAIELSGVPQAGNTLTCSSGDWSGEPTIVYSFIDSSGGQVLQSGVSSTYSLTAADVGRTIMCEVQATNAGGTGAVRTNSLRAIEPGRSLSPPPTSGSPAPGLPTPSSPGSPTSAPSGSPTSAPSGSLILPPSGTGGVEAVTIHNEGVQLAGTSLAVQGNGVTLAKLDCKEAEGCNGTLTLLAKHTAKRKGGKKATHSIVKIGTASFSLEAGQTMAVKIHLNATGRVLLGAASGRLAANLAIEEMEIHTWTEGVHLVAQAPKVKGSHKHKR